MATASLISRLSQAVEQIEERRRQNRPLKIVKVRRGFNEEPHVAKARHFAARPEDRDANIVIFKFCHDEELANVNPHCCPQSDHGRQKP